MYPHKAKFSKMTIGLKLKEEPVNRGSNIFPIQIWIKPIPVSYTHLRAHETPEHLVCRILVEKK